MINYRNVRISQFHTLLALNELHIFFQQPLFEVAFWIFIFSMYFHSLPIQNATWVFGEPLHAVTKLITLCNHFKLNGLP